MTVQTNTNVASFNGNGVTQIFPIAFKFNNDTDLVVLLVDDATGAISQLTLNSDYTVSGEGDEEGGLINVVVAPASGKRLKVTRLVDILQLTDLRNQGKFFAEVHEDALDLLTMIAQQHQSEIALSLRVSAADSPPARIPSAAQRAGKLLAFDQDGNPTTALPIADSSTALRDELVSNGGAAIIGTATGQTVEQRLAEVAETQAISPFSYGAIGDGVADDTAAMQAAYTALLAESVRVLDLEGGNFRVSHLDWDAAGGVLVKGGGSITGFETGAYESVLTVRNAVDFNVSGRLRVSASYNSGYECAVAMYDDGGAGFAKNNFENIAYIGAKVGLRIGTTALPDALLSESTIFGGYFYGCPTCVELIGSQLVYSLVGMHLISDVFGVPAGKVAEWATLPRTAVRSFGANFSVIGGSAHITDVDNGLLFDLRPISSANADIGNRFGTCTIVGTNIETASQLARLWNPANLPSLKDAGGFQMTAVTGYHSQDLYELIVAYDDFPGYIDVRANPGFSAAVARTKLSINAGASLCRIYADESSFGRNFLTGFAGISGGTLYFGEQKILEARNLGGQAIAANATTALKFTEKPGGIPGNIRFGGAYNTSSGVFTVPPGGLKSVRVNLNIDVGAARPDSLVNVTVNGATITGYAGTSGGRYLNSTLDVGDLPAGATMTINFVAQGGTSAFSFASSANDRVSVYARR